MSDIHTRFAVVIVDLDADNRYLDAKDHDYMAKVISNTQGGELTREGRNYVFGRTIGEVEFWEGDSEEEVEAVAECFNRLWEDRRLYQRPHKLAQGIRHTRKKVNNI